MMIIVDFSAPFSLMLLSESGLLSSVGGEVSEGNLSSPFCHMWFLCSTSDFLSKNPLIISEHAQTLYRDTVKAFSAGDSANVNLKKKLI